MYGLQISFVIFAVEGLTMPCGKSKSSVDPAPIINVVRFCIILQIYNELINGGNVRSYKNMFNVRAEERYVVSGGNHHPYVGMDRVEGKCRRHMDIAPYYHRDMTVR